MRILVSGATGCIGARLCRAIVAHPGNHLVIHARSAAKVSTVLGADGFAQYSIGDLAGATDWMRGLPAVEQAVLTATAWSGPDCERANVEGTLRLMDQLLGNGCRRIYYLSTASLLDARGGLRPEDLFAGHDYLSSKHRLLLALKVHPQQERIVVIYPTLVISDRNDPPSSAAARSMDWLAPRLRWVCRLRGDACFHYVHAEDLAQLLVRWLLRGLPDDLEAPLVVGSPPQSLDQVLCACQALLGHRGRRRIPFSARVVSTLARLTRVRLSAWDRYCLESPDLCFERIITPSEWGVVSRAPTAAGYLQQWIGKAR